MAAPNISANTSIIGKTFATSLTGTNITTTLSNSVDSNKVYKVNSIIASNTNGVAFVDISISIYDGSADRYLVKTLSVPPDATQVVLTKESYLYLEEGISIRAQAGTANGIDLVISYEEIS